MRIIWSSNSPLCPTGYGLTTACCTQNLKRMGHEVAIFAFYGLEGSKTEWGDIPIYPNNPRDWGIVHAPMWYNDWKADFLITLVDIFVLNKMPPELKWVPIVPIDHYPPIPGVLNVIKTSPGIIKVLTESRFGVKALGEQDIEASYISHPTNCGIFTPRDDWRQESRGRYQWEDKFVIGTVGTNHHERKNWNVSFKAVKALSERHPGKVMWYLHTDPVDTRGIDLAKLRMDLGMVDITRFPNQTELHAGIETETLARAYNVFDVFLLPSKGEGFGVPLIEAQACGVPIITTKCTAQEELLGGGWFIEDLIPIWTTGGSWQFECKVEEVVERLEQAYQAWKDGSIGKERVKARMKALEYDEPVVFEKYWTPVLEDIALRLKHPESFKRYHSYDSYYKMRGEQEREIEKSWEEDAKSPLHKAGMWHNENRNDICLRMLGGIPKGKRILDIGAGRKVEFVFIDKIDAGEIVKGDIIPNEEMGVIKADVENLQFEEHSFDVVICRELLEHVIDVDKAINEINRVLKNKGYLLATVPNGLSTGLDKVEHVRAFSPKQFLTFLTKHGFKIIDKRGNVPNIIVKKVHGLFHEPQMLPEYKELAEGFDENPLSYYVGTQLFVLAQKVK